MFSNMGLHIIKFPTGKFGYVGSIPVDLATEVPATTADVMGGRCHYGPNKELLSYKFPVFDSRVDAVKFAESKGHKVISSE